MTAARTIEHRVDRLESESEIRALVHRYAELCDAAYDPDGLADLFTEDATWSSRTRDGSVDFGRYEGREAIRGFFAGASTDLGPMTLHYLLAPRVELAENGKSATGVCYLLAILDQRPAASPPGSADRERVRMRPQPRGAAQECAFTDALKALSRKTESLPPVRNQAP